MGTLPRLGPTGKRLCGGQHCAPRGASNEWPQNAPRTVISPFLFASRRHYGRNERPVTPWTKKAHLKICTRAYVGFVRFLRAPLAAGFYHGGGASASPRIKLPRAACDGMLVPLSSEPLCGIAVPGGELLCGHLSLGSRRRDWAKEKGLDVRSWCARCPAALTVNVSTKGTARALSCRSRLTEDLRSGSHRGC